MVERIAWSSSGHTSFSPRSHLLPFPLMAAQALRAVGRSAIGFRRTAGGAPRSRPYECDMAPVSDDLRADFDQLLAQAGYRPPLHRLGHCQRAHEIPEIIGQRMKLKTHGISGESPAG